MYRAIISTTGGNAKNFKLEELRKALVRQFIHSPFTPTIAVEVNQADSPMESLIAAHPSRIQTFSSISELETQDMRNIVIQLSEGATLWEQARGLSVASWNFVAPIHARSPGLGHAELAHDIHKADPGIRICDFQYGRLILPDRVKVDYYKGKMDLDQLKDTAYSIYSQFLPTRYREINTDELAQAIRLNFETCAGMTTIHYILHVHSIGDTKDARGVETMSFEDCMQIIGRDDRI